MFKVAVMHITNLLFRGYKRYSKEIGTAKINSKMQLVVNFYLDYIVQSFIAKNACFNIR